MSEQSPGLKLPELNDAKAWLASDDTQMFDMGDEGYSFIQGARWQHTQDSAHFDATVAELLAVIEGMREALMFSLGKFNTQIDTQEWLSYASKGAEQCRKALAQTEAKLKELEGK